VVRNAYNIKMKDNEKFLEIKAHDVFFLLFLSSSLLSFNGGYFLEWECGADLSADTIEAKMRIVERQGDYADSVCTIANV
jgi:hypothetical protein